ncbi:MAG: type VI secretion system tip protein VgrG [Phycisphaerae bacterium]|jgi:type VI secretion system secreted protein VgrG
MTPSADAPASLADLRFRVAGFDTSELRVTALDGTEGIGELFSFRIRLCSEDDAIDLESMLGLPAALEIDGEHGLRRVQGIIARFERTGHGTNLTHYEAHLVPPHWLLTRRIQSRVFNGKRCPRTDVIGIVSKVLTDAGFPAEALKVATARTYETREFTVQYRESDWDFVSRLLEHEGIYGFFERHDDGCRLVLMDSKDLHEPFVPSGFEVPYRELSGLVEESEFVFRARAAGEVQFGAVSLDDFNFRLPGKELRLTARSQRFAALEMADAPGDYQDSDRGRRLVHDRLQEQQCARHGVTMTATARGLRPGYRFTLTDHPCARLNGDYLVLSLAHRAEQPQSAEEEAGGSDGSRYEVEIRAIPADVQYRPPRVTPRPTVLGSQTAIVVGPPGEEIYTDEFGRVEVRFHWDQEAEFDAGASCWIRASQGWAGGQYGMMFLPRVGQEVIVDFLEGDPDQPIITGRVYNRDHMPPYMLPDKRTISTIRTCSSPNAGGGNEIRFDDAKGGEQLLLFAQNSMHLRSQGNRYETVGAHQHRTVQKDSYELVKENRHSWVKLDRLEQTDGNLHLRVEKDVKESVLGRKTTHVMKKYAILNSEGLVLESDTSISLKVKGNFIRIDDGGVTIMGKMVNINSGGSADTWEWDSPDTPTLPEPAATTTFGRNCTYASAPAEADALTLQDNPQPPADDKPETLTSWIEIELVDDFGRPCRGELYIVTEPDGAERRGSLNEKGVARVGVKSPGLCRISFPNLDSAVWDRAAPPPPSGTGPAAPTME